MYITDKHAFIHLNKAAGVFVKDWMIKNLGATVHRYKHAPLRMLNSDQWGKKRIGVVRNPFTWYESYYHYLCQERKLTSFSFRLFIETYTLHPRALFDFMGKKVRRKFENLYPPITLLPIGSWTYHYINYFQFNSRKTLMGGELVLDHDLDHLMKVESLQDDMVKVFGKKYEKSIRNYPRKNVSKKKRVEWTDDLIGMVMLRDGRLMEKLGYGYPDKKSAR